MKKIVYLVTGATGFLGSTIVRQLVNENKMVRGFVLPNDESVKYLPQEVEIFKGDLCNKNDLEAFFTVPEEYNTICLHIASIVTVNPDYNQRVIDVNVGGTNNIIDLCLSHNECKKLVYCSSTGAIPELSKGNAIKEVERYDATMVKGCYSQSKALATQAVLDAVKERGLSACVVFPSGILGPFDYAKGETTKTIIEILKAEMPAGINGTFNLCDVRDLADATIKAAEKGKNGEGYILANEAVTFKNFTRMLHNLSGCKKMKMFLPIWIANFIARKMEKKAKKKGERPLMTTFSVYNLARNNDFDSTKAKKELGYKTRSYEETLKDEINWLKEQNLI